MVNTGDTAWILTSAALVLLMTPGLALFYGGMVRAQERAEHDDDELRGAGLISVLWVLYGYSMAFGDDVGGGLLGNPSEYFGLDGPDGGHHQRTQGGLPAMAFVGFQAVFAIITVALISGAIADRAKFGAWMVFAGIWATLVYFPVAHWVFDFTPRRRTSAAGSPTTSAAIDFAGGTAVHINAGAAGLALALVLGKRRGFGKERDAPAQPAAGHARRRPAVVRLVRLQRRLRARGQQHRRGRLGQHPGRHRRRHRSPGCSWRSSATATPTSLGAASGVVAGLVAITPACSSVSPLGAIVVGAVAGVALRPGRRPEVPLRLRRLARRRRRPPGRRPRRHDPRSASSPRPRRRPASTACSTAAARPAVASGRRGARRPGLLLRRHAGHRHRDPEDDGLPDHRGGRGQPASTTSSTPSRATTSPRLGGSSGSTAPSAGQAPRRGP